jgi:hypothetical protein
MPRLDRDAAGAIVALHRGEPLAAVADAMPDRSPVVTYSPVGGQRASDDELADLRRAVVELAHQHGFPGPPVRLAEFDGRCARLVHERLAMIPHEASHEEVWSCLTCCWLLDIALWRFGEEADERRFIGNVNRNTFRRLWWRAEILGPDVDLEALGEDELVNIMERSTIAGDRRLARTVAHEFIARVAGGETGERMQLMREAMKRLLRLTPIVDFPALPDEGLRSTVVEVFDAAAAGLVGQAPAVVSLGIVDAPAPSSLVTKVVVPDAVGPRNGPDATADLMAIGEVALDIARRTGRVTNMTLREVVPVTSDDAREVFAFLMAQGALARRGVKRGTHYVLADGGGTEDGPSGEPPRPEPASSGLPAPPAFARPSETSSDSALRRLLKRRR